MIMCLKIWKDIHVNECGFPSLLIYLNELEKYLKESYTLDMLLLFQCMKWR